MTYEKFEKDGRVAVIYSPDYGAGWYSWNTEFPGLLFDKDIVQAILDEKLDLAREIAKKKYPEAFVDDQFLAIEWVPKGCAFEVKCFDGSESVIILLYNALYA